MRDEEKKKSSVNNNRAKYGFQSCFIPWKAHLSYPINTKMNNKEISKSRLWRKKDRDGARNQPHSRI